MRWAHFFQRAPSQGVLLKERLRKVLVRYAAPLAVKQQEDQGSTLCFRVIGTGVTGKAMAIQVFMNELAFNSTVNVGDMLCMIIFLMTVLL